MDERTIDGLRFLAGVTADGRALERAVRAFIEAGDRVRLSDCRRIGMRFGLLRPTVLIKDAARARGWPELDVSDADFDRWFAERAALWFDVYVDRERQVAFIGKDDFEALWGLACESSGCGFDPERLWNGLHARVKADPAISPHRKALIKRLASGLRLDVALAPDAREDVPARFESFCRAHGVTPLRVLQEGRTGLDRKSWVWLALDRDGIAKVFKEIIAPVDDRLGPRPGEDEVYARLGRQPFAPVWYGCEEHDGLKLGRQSVCHGQSLAEMLRHGPMLRDEAATVIGGLARILDVLHAKGILYLDLRPENVVIHDDEVRLLDFDGSRLLPERGTHVETAPQDAAYVPPETLMRLEASRASDIFQLGVLWHVLRTGEHPFSAYLPRGESRIEQLGAWSLANAVSEYRPDIFQFERDPYVELIKRMLRKDEPMRPTAAEVIEGIKELRAVHLPAAIDPKIRRRSRLTGARDRPAALFPARMGLPHKGHVEFMVRTLELGYRLVVSLQRSWTITDRDPYHKWDVMKMVARSLFDRGFSSDDIRFVFTPFFRTPEEMRMHFAMMPGLEEVAVVASGNDGMREILPTFPFLDQRAVFGAEDEDYEDRSWGETLRTAVREGDRETFDRYAASGVEKVMGFDELRERYARDPVEFVPGRVLIEIGSEDGTPLADGAWVRYQTPIESAARILEARGIATKVVDPYDVVDRLTCWGALMRLRHERSTLDDEGNLRARFTLLKG